MMNTADLQATQKASVGQWFELADTALDETAKWMDMNLQVCRESIEDMARSCAGACEVRDLGSALQWQASALNPWRKGRPNTGRGWRVWPPAPDWMPAGLSRRSGSAWGPNCRPGWGAPRPH